MPASASIILASRNEGVMLRRTLDAMLNAIGRVPYEIIVVDDGSTDNSASFNPRAFHAPVRVIRTPGLGVAPARNAGARIASGEMLVFCDAHMTMSGGWVDALARALNEEGCDAVTPGIGPLRPHGFVALSVIAASSPLDTVGCGRVFRTLTSNAWLPRHSRPVECPVLSGGCFAVRSDVWRKIGGYEDAFRGYGYDEEEISLKLWLFGYRLMTAPGVVVLHQFRPAAPYPVIGEDAMHNQMYAALCHFSDERTERLLALLRSSDGFERAMGSVFTADLLKRKRCAYRARRTHDDDWYFRRFAPTL